MQYDLEEILEERLASEKMLFRRFKDKLERGRLEPSQETAMDMSLGAVIAIEMCLEKWRG